MAAKKSRLQPSLVFADEQGQIYDHPELKMLCRRGRELALPRPDELIPLPEGSDLYLLPGRHPLGLDPAEGRIELLSDVTAVAGFVCPGHTLSAVAAYRRGPDCAAHLPMFSYGSVGFARDRFWVAAKKVDMDTRQDFCGISEEKIRDGVTRMLQLLPKNRLAAHLGHCALGYGCPAAKNLALGRFEAPLPTARTCNARCVGCISLQDEGAGMVSPQQRIGFTPTVQEIVELMELHSGRAKNPIFSFGQGCEGEPLTEAPLLAESIAAYRKGPLGMGTVNVNTNGSLPQAMPPLIRSGLSSIRVSLNSAVPGHYHAYYRPRGYVFEDVRQTVLEAKKGGLFVSLNLLFFPGVTDTECEAEALAEFVRETEVDFIQMRNLSLDPEMYLDLSHDWDLGPSMGLKHFLKRIKKAAPWVGIGYFNPFLPDKLK